MKEEILTANKFKFDIDLKVMELKGRKREEDYMRKMWNAYHNSFTKEKFIKKVDKIMDEYYGK